MGVFAPLVGIIGSMQAAEALKLLAGAGKPLTGRLLLLDALTHGVRTVTLKRDPACAVCAARADRTTDSATVRNSWVMSSD